MAAIDAEVARGVWTEGALAPEIARPDAPRRAAVRPASRALDATRGLRRGLWAVALAGGVFVAVAAGSAAVVMQAVDVSTAEAAVTSLQGQNRTLTVQLAELENPQRIERVATQSLGLVRPSAYVPVPSATAPRTARPRPGRAATALVNLPSGPAPGGAVSLWRQGMGWVQTHAQMALGRKSG